MSIKLRDTTPVGERLTPAATEAELLWFRKKRRIALGRTVLVTGGMAVLYYAGSLLRDDRYAGNVFPLIGFGVIAISQAYLVVRVALTNNLVKDIRERRLHIRDEQRRRIFLAALDKDTPAI